MLQALINSTTLPLLERVAVFGERRQEILAGNIANIDTPEYRARDLPVADFQEALKQAVAAKEPSKTSSSEEASDEATEDILKDPELYKAIDRPNQNVIFRDGGNRNIEQETTEMTKNVMMQNYAVELMNAQFRMLQTVLSERA